MNLFKPFTLTWWQAGAFKIAAGGVGIILGAYFSPFFIRYLGIVFVLCACATLYVIAVWWNQAKRTP